MMLHRFRRFAAASLVAAGFATGSLVVLSADVVRAAAEDKGQAELDAAFDARITAKSLDDLEQVIKLARNAIKLGLGPANVKEAKKILASAYYQRGESMAERVLEAPTGDPRVAPARIAAITDLNEAVENDPELSSAYVFIARLQLLPGGDVKQARKMIDAALDSKLTDDETRAKALTLRSAFAEKPAARVADLDEAIRLNPGDPQAFRLRAAAKLSANKPAESVADFDEALKIAPNHAATHEARGLALAAQGNFAEARKSLSRAGQLLPQSPAPVILRGRVNLQAGDHKAAIADADEALKITPDLPEGLLLRSRARQAAGDNKGALADVEKLLSRFPDAPSAILSRVTLLLDEQKFAETIPDLEKLSTLDPDDNGILLQLAVVYNAVKNHEKTLEVVDKLLKRDAGNWRALRVRGDSYLSAGKRTEAIADYEAALKIEPKDTGILNNLAWILCTSPDAKFRNGKRALELAELACKLTGHDAVHILSTLAAAYAEQGDFDAAKEWSNKAIAKAETDKEKESLRKELASYEAKKPWREALAGEADKPDEKSK